MASKFLGPRQMKRLRERAYEMGAVFKENPFPLRKGDLPVSPNDMFWRISGRCQKPVTVVYRSREWGKGPHHRTEYLEMETKCRRCDACLKDRAHHWRLRAESEWRAAPRTWLWTLTLAPEEHFRCLSRAIGGVGKKGDRNYRCNLDAQGIDFEALTPAEQFELRHREAARLVQLALKRLRKGGDGVPATTFRYMMVAEAHKSGLPHYHLMIHEIAGGGPIVHRALKRAWSAGFCDAKLISDPRACGYAAKYLGKSLAARVRASLGYGLGQSSSDIVNAPANGALHV